MHARGCAGNGFFHLRDGWLEVWHGNFVNTCTGAKFERTLLFEERMEKNGVAFSAIFFFFNAPFYFDAQ